MGDSPDPRARLAALAEAGRAKREAEAAAQEYAARQDAALEAEQAQRHQRLMSYTTWSSLSGWMQLLWWALFIPFPSMFVVGILHVIPWFLFTSLAVSAVLVLAAVLGTLWARRQDIRFRAALPFSLIGYEAVLGTPARSVCCEIEFVHTCPPTAMLADLFRLLKEPIALREVEGTMLTLEANPVDYSLLDDHCRWMPRWFRAFNKKVLQPVHAVYPIRAIRLH
jgi:hypothetical protein